MHECVTNQNENNVSKKNNRDFHCLPMRLARVGCSGHGGSAGEGIKVAGREEANFLRATPYYE